MGAYSHTHGSIPGTQMRPSPLPPSSLVSPQRKLRLHLARGSPSWAKLPELNPAVQALVALEMHFENLNEVTNVNLATELGLVLQLPTSASMQEIVQRLDKVVEPITRNYTTVEDFLNYLKASKRRAVICHVTTLGHGRD
eukprot:1690276-Rhodomonas_salina.1